MTTKPFEIPFEIERLDYEVIECSTCLTINDLKLCPTGKNCEVIFCHDCLPHHLLHCKQKVYQSLSSNQKQRDCADCSDNDNDDNDDADD